jgi:D-arabinose 1-dehydrogenase-like Zn-dependent alcohol dehydrogenase
MGSIPTEQWAQVIEKTGGPVDYKKIPVQKPASDEVLVNIKFSGVCHTDLHAVNGDWPLVSSQLLSHFFRSTITNIPLGHQATSCWRP